MSNPIKHFLGIDTDPKAPDVYLIFKIEEHANAEQVAQAADATIAKVRAQRPGDRQREWSALIDFLTKAKERLIAERRVKNPTAVFDPPNAAGEKKIPKGKSPPQKNNATPEPSPVKTRNNPSNAPAVKSSSVKTSSTHSPPALSPSKVPATIQQTKPQAPIAAAAAPPVLTEKKSVTSKTKPKKTESAPSREDDYSFTLDAPDEKDSFDSDTHLSGHSLQPAAVMATTIDPMAPVADPTLEWHTYDANQLHQDVITSFDVNEKSEVAAKPSAAFSEKTFYTDSYRMKSRNGIMIGGTVIAMLVVGAISYALIFGPTNGADGSKAAGSEKVAENDANKTSSDKPTALAAKNLEEKNRKSPASKPDPILEVSGGAKNEPESKEPAKPNLKPMPSVDPPTPTVKPEPPTQDLPTPDSMDPNDADMETNPPKPKNSEIAELASLLTSVRTKLVERDLVEANRMLEKAGSLPMVPEHKDKLERLKTVTELYGKFWNMVVEGCGKLKGLDEIKFSDTNIISVIESSEDRIVYRAIGKRFEKEPRDLQIGIAMKIAEKDFDDAAAESRLIKGSVYAVEAFNDSDRAERAKELWEEAGLLGTNTDELVLFLDDQYDLLDGFITKTKLPTPEEMKAAQERFRATYASESKTAAKNAETAMAFATKLLADAVKLDDAPDRHANFVAAVFYATKSGDAVFLMKALSDMNKWFNVDLDQKTLDSLTTMNKMRLKPDQKREIARSAFEYMDRAKRANNQDLELKFATLAFTAAKGTRDQKFIATANQELQRVKASQK